jgi:hypothetical protein
LTNTIEKLDMQKLGELKTIGTRGVSGLEGPTGTTGNMGSVGSVIEGTLPAKLMEVSPPTIEEFVVGQESSPSDLANKTDTEVKREQHLRKVYTTHEDVTKQIASREIFLAEETAKYADDPVGLARIQHGVKLVQQDISILKEIHSDIQPTTPTLADVFSTPIPQPTPTPTSPTLEEISSAPIPQPAQTPIEEATPTTPTLAEIFSKPVTEPIEEELASTTAIPNVEESISTKLQTTSAESSTNMFTRIADFASNILPDPSKILDWFDFSEPAFEQSVTGDNDMGQFESIYIRGESVFVDEIAKLKSPSAQTASGEQQEDSQKVVKKLDELIKLMQNGGISVNMDGRKVSKSVAKAHD